MNEIVLKGILKDIQPSHTIDGISFDKAKIICKRENGNEDIINLKFKTFSNIYKEGDEISIKGNLRSYSYKIEEDKNKVVIYVFTYFDQPTEINETNKVIIDGRICKIDPLRTTQNGKNNIHFILANNLIPKSGLKRLNSYIPCIAWDNVARDISKYGVNTRLKLVGELHSREHKKIHPDNSLEIRVAHELLIKDYEVVE